MSNDKISKFKIIIFITVFLLITISMSIGIRMNKIVSTFPMSKDAILSETNYCKGVYMDSIYTYGSNFEVYDVKCKWWWKK